MRSMRNCFSLELQSERTSFASVSYFETSRGELSYKSASIVVSRVFATALSVCSPIFDLASYRGSDSTAGDIKYINVEEYLKSL